MGEHTEISWTDHTFSPWWGCAKVSDACKFCYAETFSRRVGHGARLPTIWGGESSARKMQSDKYWRQPLKWARDAEKAGVRRRVFCASMADVFEDRPDLVEPRARLFALILETMTLDWLLLTKRPENAARLWLDAARASKLDDPDGLAWMPNVWLGTTVEDQKRANERIPHLLAVPAAVRFLSVEPMLGPVDLSCVMVRPEGPGFHAQPLPTNVLHGWRDPKDGIHWVICGGESGHGARPMHPRWASSLREQCAAAGVAFHFKQWGEWLPIDRPWTQDSPEPLAKNEQWMNTAGGQGFHGEDVWRLRRVGKKVAGHLLDGAALQAWPEARS